MKSIKVNVLDGKRNVSRRNTITISKHQPVGKLKYHYRAVKRSCSTKSNFILINKKKTLRNLFEWICLPECVRIQKIELKCCKYGNNDANQTVLEIWLVKTKKKQKRNIFKHQSTKFMFSNNHIMPSATTFLCCTRKNQSDTPKTDWGT